MYYKVIISYRRRKSREGRYLVYGRSMLIRWPEVSWRGRHMRKELKKWGKSRGCWGREHFKQKEGQLQWLWSCHRPFCSRNSKENNVTVGRRERAEDDITEVRLGAACKPINKFGIYYTFPRRFWSPWCNLIQILEGPLCLLCKKRLVVGQRSKEGTSIWITEILKQKMIVSGWESCGYKWWTKDEFWG